MPLSFLKAPLARKQGFPIGLLAVVVQLLLVVYVFRHLIFHPGDYLIINYYDGIKSYFSIESFLRQPLNTGMVVEGHNFPFGEYMYYTDSTPLLVQLVHVLVQLVPSLQPYGLYLYDLGIISGLVLSSWLLGKILRPANLPAWLFVLVVVGLPWLGPQTWRLRVGHMSLSYTPTILFTIWALQKMYLAWPTRRPSYGALAMLVGGIFVSSYLHFYYLAILGALAGFFFLWWCVQNRLTRQPWLPIAVRGGAALLVALVLTAGSLMVLDGRYNERPVGSSGYGYIDWKLQAGGFFRTYEYNKVHFLIERTLAYPYESMAYLGGFVLYGLLAALLLRLAQRLPVGPERQEPMGRFLLLLLLASLPLVFIAFGETYGVDNDTYTMYNYLNPFYWLHFVTDRVTQFRAVGRFVWPFWWALNLLVVWAVARYWQQTGPAWVRWVVAALACILLLDTRDAMTFYQTGVQVPNLLTDKTQRPEMDQLMQWMDTQKYQAILPVPFYHVGSEGDYTYTIDPDDPHCNHTYQLSLITNLPLMSHKAVRTPPEQAQQLFSIFRPEGPDPALLQRLGTKPVLVFLDTSFYNGQNNYYAEGLKGKASLPTFERGDDFIREHKLKRIRQQGAYSLYEWYPNAPTQ
ncbi:hypothetical protein [Hymenobacter metallicola]|uniref:DUF6311 domain-containing protein n=1 Tax=Hymenobacter metallicola TaxID=2563114 RepID=A0A4Z0QHQ7_9BACT|nr:hypothetical protein [Hymenobacter metallicola]TGE28541.1 hypothetical protein E5K02_03490 [Hymenobacter metallicola]